MISDNFPIDQDKVKPGDFDHWASEGLQVAETYVYPGFVLGSPPSKEYMKKAEQVLKTRMHYGSVRLAETIKDIFESQTGLFLQ